MTPAEISSPPRVLHVLSQCPELTGSGVTVDALVREAAARGWDQWVVCGIPAGQPIPRVGGLPFERVHAITFGRGGDLPFPVPGMSDVMPYQSTVWSRMTREQLDRYRAIWRTRLRRLIAAAAPQIIHVNHLWLVASLLHDLAPDVPSVLHCHATGLRQLVLCPHLAQEVVAGNRRHDRFVVLHDTAAAELAQSLAVDASRVHVVGAGYRDDLFHPHDVREESDRAGQILFVGKFAAAKGLPVLLDAVAALAAQGRTLTLHVAGEGSGEAAVALRARMVAMAPLVRIHGRLGQPELAALMRRCYTLVLPSFYEGLPLVLIEARACGCRVVATALDAIRDHVSPVLGDALTLVPLPRLVGPDTPVAADLPQLRRDLAAAIAASLERPPAEVASGVLEPFTWHAVFARLETVWTRAMAERAWLAGPGWTD